MSYVVKVIQDTSQLLGLTPALATPLTSKKTTPIKPTEDLIKEFPERFQGIGQSQSEYTVRQCDNTQPVIHASWKCLISIHPKVKAEVDNVVKSGVITTVNELMDWASSVACVLWVCFVSSSHGNLSHALGPGDWRHQHSGHWWVLLFIYVFSCEDSVQSKRIFKRISKRTEERNTEERTL